MRWLCLLMAFLVMGLSVQPACAAFSLVGNSGPTIDACCQDEAPQKDEHPDSKKECHGCNPFHSCSCCVASIVLPLSFRMVAPLIHQHAPATGDYQTPRLPVVAYDFWQPPQLS